LPAQGCQPYLNRSGQQLCLISTGSARPESNYPTAIDLQSLGILLYTSLLIHCATGIAPFVPHSQGQPEEAKLVNVIPGSN